MANIKLTELDPITALDSSDVLVAVDVSADETHKITAANVFRTLPDGTAAAPALSFASDQDLGLYRTGANGLAISTGGTQRVTVDGSGNVTISGDLTVSGATTTVESTTVTIDDKNIELGSVATPTDTTADGGGITLKGATDKEIKWVNSTGYWTFNTGIEVGGHLQIDDDNQIRVGDGADLRIFHDGSNSYVQNNSSTLVIDQKADDQDIVLRSDDGSGNVANYIRCDGGEGRVELYHYGSKKFETTSTGVDVTGEVQCDSLDVDGSADFTGEVDLHNNLSLQDNDKINFGGGNDLQIYHDGNNSFIKDAGTGELKIAGTTRIVNGANTETLALFVPDGQVELFHNNSKKFATKSDGIDVTGEVQCDSLDVDGNADISGNLGIATTSATFPLQVETSATGTTSGSNGVILVQSKASGRDAHIRFGDSVNATARVGYLSNSLYAWVNGAERFRVDSSGRLLLGTSSSVDVASTAAAEFQVKTAGNITAAFHSIANAAGPAGILALGHGRGTAGGVLQNDDVMGEIRFAGGDGTDLETQGAAIVAQVDGTPGSNNMPGRLVFRTNSGTSSTTERLRIDSNGVLISSHATINGGVIGTNGNELRLQSDINANGTPFTSFYTGSSEQMRLDSSGRLMLGTTTEGEGSADNLTVVDSGNCGITIRSGTSSSGNLFFSDATSGTDEYDGYIQYRHGDRALRFATNATERFRITNTGAWAIEGASNYGTSGQVLTSNGNDAPTWQDAGAGSVGGANAISMNDSVNINFGNSNDLQIYHDGTNSWVKDAGTNALVLDSNGPRVTITKNGASETMANFNTDGSVDLYYDNAKKFATKSDGIDVTGEVQCDSLDVDGSADITGNVTLHANLDLQDNDKILLGTGDDLQIYHNGNHSYIDDTGTGDLILRGAGEGIKLQKYTGETLAHFLADGASKLYYNDSKKFETKSDGVLVTGEVQCDSLDVDGGAHFSGDAVFEGGASAVTIGGSSDIRFVNGNWTGDTTSPKIQGHGNYLYITGGSNGIIFRYNGTDRCRVDSNGHFRPAANNTYDLGTSSLRWRNVYTNDLNLSNEGSTNDVDGTWGNYTIQEGEDDLFLINRRNGKKYKFNLTEVS